jgi:hypothetical protein
MKARLCVALLLATGPIGAGASDFSVIRLKLDPVSVVSIGDQEFVSIPPQEIPLRAYPSGAPDSLALRMDPSDFPTASIPIRGSTVSAGLAAPAKGFIQRSGGGEMVVELNLVLHLTRGGADGGGSSRDLPVRLTTERIETIGPDGTRKLDVGGARAKETTGAVQLVGEVIAGEGGGLPEGAPVYVVLSGSLEGIPDF